MNSDQAQGKWQQLKGAVKQKWGKLTDDDIEQIGGRREQFAGKLQDRYGLTKDEALRRVDEWMKTQQVPGSRVGHFAEEHHPVNR